MTSRRFGRTAMAAIVMIWISAPAAAQQPRESTTCQSDIASATVVTTFCAHREGDTLVLDLLILWRGAPGWFQWKGTGTRGSSGSTLVGKGIKGAVSHSTSYGDVTIAYGADFERGEATIEHTTIRLDSANTVIVDDADASPRITATRWTRPVLPLVGDWNLALTRRSSGFMRDLRCDVPMPAPPPVPQPPVVTVCDRLKMP
jgi:hypothetical protein